MSVISLFLVAPVMPIPYTVQDVLVKMFRLYVTLHSEEHFSFPMPPLFSISLLPSFHSDIIHLGKHGGNQVGAGAVAESCILVCKQRRGRREKESEKRERRSDMGFGNVKALLQ